MILLGIDTCGSVGSLALARVVAGDLEPVSTAELAGKTTAAMLVPELDRMLAGCGLTPASVDALVVVDGPGSFTGIRVGLGAAKALAEALGIPLYAISRLKVLSSCHAGADVLLDAGRGEFYRGSWPELVSGGPELVSGESDPAGPEVESLLDREELAKLGLTRPTVACEEKVAAAASGVQLVPAPTALDAIRAALPAVLAGECADAAALDGRYLRQTGLYRTTPVCG